jgi:hypothetical protein
MAFGKMPSAAQANINRDTERIMAGKSLSNAIAAPATMAMAQPEGSR